MWLYCRLLLALSFLSTALADVVVAHVNGMVSGTVNVFVVCTSPDCEEPVVSDGFSLSGANNQLGTFTRSGQASAAGESVFVQLQQTTGATVTGLMVDVQTTAIVDGFGLQWSVQGALFNHYSLGFTLSTQSLMHLTGFNRLNFDEFQQISLDGPQGPIGVLFDGPAPSHSFDYSFPLMPGLYTLDVLDESPFFGVGPQPDPNLNTHVVDFSNFSFNADFTPIVPEPKWGFIVPTLLVISLGYASFKIRSGSHSVPSRTSLIFRKTDSDPRPHKRAPCLGGPGAS